jgi:hypothetical protein
LCCCSVQLQARCTLQPRAPCTPACQCDHRRCCVASGCCTATQASLVSGLTLAPAGEVQLRLSDGVCTLDGHHAPASEQAAAGRGGFGTARHGTEPFYSSMRPLKGAGNSTLHSYLAANASLGCRQGWPAVLQPAYCRRCIHLSSGVYVDSTDSGPACKLGLGLAH